MLPAAMMLRTFRRGGKMTEQKTLCRHWTSGEENQLRHLLDAGMTAAAMSLKLNRTPHAIYPHVQRGGFCFAQGMFSK
jgi:hypothetical protein